MKIIIILVLILTTSCTLNRNFIKEAAIHVIKLEDSSGSGTAFYVDYFGRTFLVSNAHICSDSKGFKLTEGFSKVLAKSIDYDLCILESYREYGLKLSETSLEPLDKVSVIGHPLGNKLTARSGYYVDKLDISNNVLSRGSIQVAVPIFTGNSGSPVLDHRGTVVGIIYAADARTYADGIAVSKENLIKFLHKHREIK